MKNHLSIAIVIACAFCCIFHTAYCKGKLTVAVPKKSKGKSKGAVLWKSFGQSVIGKVFREMKVAFSSELEALALKVTKPTNAAVPLEPIDTIAASVNEAYEDPEYVIGLLAKFSRKFSEDNIYTKIKSLLSIQLIMHNAGDKAQAVLSKCMHSLRSEKDNKVNMLFFSTETIERLAVSSANLADIETIELAREYAVYLFEYLEARGDKLKIKDSGNDRVDSLLSLIEQGQVVEECCRRSSGPLAKQILERAKDDRNWASKQLMKLLEAGISDENLEAEVVDLFDRLGVSIPHRAKSAHDSPITESKKVESSYANEPTTKPFVKNTETAASAPVVTKAAVKIAPKLGATPTTTANKKSTAIPGPLKAAPKILTPSKEVPSKASPTKATPAKNLPPKAVPLKVPAAKTVPKKTLPAKMLPKKVTQSSQKSPKLVPKKNTKKEQRHDYDDDDEDYE